MTYYILLTYSFCSTPIPSYSSPSPSGTSGGGGGGGGEQGGPQSDVGRVIVEQYQQRGEKVLRGRSYAHTTYTDTLIPTYQYCSETVQSVVQSSLREHGQHLQCEGRSHSSSTCPRNHMSNLVSKALFGWRGMGI